MERAGDLAGKVAIVTGTSARDGIGFASARALAAAGATVIVAGIDEAGALDCAAGLKDLGYAAAGRHVDISSEDSVRELMAYVADRHERLDVLDNNAASLGHQGDALVADMAADLWDRVMAVNARGTMLMCKHAIPLMIGGGGGSIINISSGTAEAGDFFATAYAASKGAVNTLTRYVATQYGKQGIRCNALSVGLVLTGALQAGMPESVQAVFREHILTGNIAKPDDIAEAVAFLASDRSRYITGQILPVDGGIRAHVPTTVDVARMMAGH